MTQISYFTFRGTHGRNEDSLEVGLTGLWSFAEIAVGLGYLNVSFLLF
ncbi:MAG TPA: hypothetical protein VMV48_06655 [Gallionellaceae bacterium]|nr:hypothetical protein [Gallionellaceae bacterium]